MRGTEHDKGVTMVVRARVVRCDRRPPERAPAIITRERPGWQPSRNGARDKGADERISGRRGSPEAMPRAVA